MSRTGALVGCYFTQYDTTAGAPAPAAGVLGALCLLAPPRCANARWPSLEGCSPYRVARPRVSSVFSVELNSYSRRLFMHDATCLSQTWNERDTQTSNRRSYTSILHIRLQLVPFNPHPRKSSHKELKSPPTHNLRAIRKDEECVGFVLRGAGGGSVLAGRRRCWRIFWVEWCRLATTRVLARMGPASTRKRSR